MLRVSRRVLCASSSVTVSKVAPPAAADSVEGLVENSSTTDLASITTPVAVESIKAVHSWREDFTQWQREEAEFEAAEAKRIRGFDRHNVKALDEENIEEGDKYLAEHITGDGKFEKEHSSLAERPTDEIMEGIVKPIVLQEGDDGTASVRGLVPVQGKPGENVKWVQKARDWRTVDDDGNYVVNHSQWHENTKGTDLAYRPPPEPTHIEAVRFGANVIQVKKHVTYWQWFQHNDDGVNVSIRYLNVYVIYILAISWICAFLVQEARRRFYLAQSGGNMGGEVLGKGVPQPPKIAYSEAEDKARVERALEGFMQGDGHNGDYMGNKDYQMKKIPRPKEFSYETSLAELGVQQPAFAKTAERVVRSQDSPNEAATETVRIKTPYDEYTAQGEKKPRRVQ